MLAQDSALISAIRQGLYGIAFQGMPAGKTRFIGIFDTVAAIGSPVKGMNPDSADTGEVSLVLPPGIAEQVFHITAGNECRFNFVLNSMPPVWPELVLPGAHSDTGSGKWDFAFFPPKVLYAEVTQALVIDDKDVVYTFRTLDSLQDSAITEGAWNNEVRRHAQFSKARHPPMMMLFCWDSVIDKKTYETRIVFPASLKPWEVSCISGYRTAELAITCR